MAAPAADGRIQAEADVRVLVVEDSPVLRQTVATALRSSGFAVDASADGEDGLWHANSNDYDCIVLDIMLPLRDGLSVLRALREAQKPVPVLLLTARDAVEDRVVGLNAGADDYLIKPFALVELVARVQALCRRGYRKPDPVLRCGGLEVDTVARAVRCGGVAVTLTPREYAVIEYLARRRGEVVTRAEIEAHVYDGVAELMSNVVDSTVYALRKKLAPIPGAPSLATRRGLGYVLDG